MGDYLTSLLRTAVPAAVGAVLSWLGLHGLDVPAGDREAITAGVTAVLMVAYYAGVRALEKRWPVLGVLLGSPKAPTYRTTRGTGPGVLDTTPPATDSPAGTR